jgi:hypothetical protein
MSRLGGQRQALACDEVADLVRRTRAAQGLPERITDAGVIDLIATALTSADPLAVAGGSNAV